MEISVRLSQKGNEKDLDNKVEENIDIHFMGVSVFELYIHVYLVKV